MTTEQLAIVVPALVAIVTVWIIARTQAKINRQTLGAQRTLAQQERARAAYEDMMHMVRWVMELVNATKPVWEEAGSEQPQQPEMERVRSAQARIDVHGSPKVKAILGMNAAMISLLRLGFSTACKTIKKRGVDIDKSYGHSIVDQWKKVDEIRKELHEKVQELADTAYAEMRAAPDPG